MEIKLIIQSNIEDDRTIVINATKEILLEEHSEPSRQVVEYELDTFDKHARQRLIELGWTPPEEN